MTTRASHKARGRGFECDLVHWLRERGYQAEHLALAGAKDEGDVVIYQCETNTWIIVECKAPGMDGKINLSGWTKERRAEAAHFAAARNLDPDQVSSAICIKARGKSLDQAYWVTTLGDEFSPFNK